MHTKSSARMRFWLLLPLLAAAMILSSAPAAAEERILIPGGQSIGVDVTSPGAVVVQMAAVDGEPGPAERAGIRVGDAITKVDGRAVRSGDALTEAARSGKPMALTVRRGDGEFTVTVAPERSREDGLFRLGMWVRDGAAGIGVLSYYDPETLRYGALGHGVTDPASSIVLPIEGGHIYGNRVTGVKRGLAGSPGEIRGEFFGSPSIGTVEANTSIGIYGQLTAPPAHPLYPEGLPMAERGEVRPGKAAILTTLTDNVMREYGCEILRITDRTEDGSRSMVIRVTDEALLQETGGIVQGMSGSPIIQNGKLVGAVTHVLVNDPTRGYGIFIENMLEAAD